MKKSALELLRRYPWVVLFAVFILALTAFDMTRTNRAHSQLENRYLSTRPKITFSLLMGGTFDEKFDSYINDQFVFRDTWISLKSFAESLLLKTENNGVLYGKDQYLIKKYDQIDHTRYDPNIQYVSEFLEKYPELPVTLSVIPNGYAVFPDKLPLGAALVDQRKEIAALYADLPAHARTLDLLPALEAQKDAYIYYRTDHHWTTLGAYTAAQAYAESKARSLPALETLTGHEVPGFYGTNYAKAKKAGAPPDTVTYYDIPTTRVTVAGQERDGLYDRDIFNDPEKRDKYAAFLWGNNSLTSIASDNNLYKEPGRATRVLLIKDSYGNAFAPFLTYLYDEVDVADLRYLGGLEDVLAAKEYDEVLLLYNFETLATDSHMMKLRY